MKNKLIKEIDYIQDLISLKTTKFNDDCKDFDLDSFERTKKFSKIIGLEAEKEHLYSKLESINLKEAFKKPLSAEKRKELEKLIKH